MWLVCSSSFKPGSTRGKGNISVLLASRCDTSGVATSFFGLVGAPTKALRRTYRFHTLSPFATWKNSVARSSLPTKKFKGQIVCTVLRRKEILVRIFPEFGIFVFFLNFWKIIHQKQNIYFNIFEFFWLFSGPIWSAWICRQLLSSWPWPKPSSNLRRRRKWRVSGASCRSCGNCGNIRRVCIWNF